MLTALVWFVSLIVNILNPIGILALAFLVADGEFDALIIPACIAPAGLLFGIFFGGETIAPRMFWVSSRMNIFGTLVGTAFGYALGFFNSACAIVGILMIV